jgi:flagellar protein FliS
MSQLTAARARYASDAAQTVSPARLLTMLYDRLAADLLTGEQAMLRGDVASAGEALTHAQEIILELRTTLDLDAWDGAPGLANLYGFLLTELNGANVRRDADRVAACRGLVEPLRDAWRAAAAQAAADGN